MSASAPLAANVTRLRVPPVEQLTAEASDGFEDIPPIMSPKTLGGVLQVTPKTLERWRDAGTGPTPHKLPGSSLIRYTRADVLAWLASGRTEVDA